MSIEPNSRWFRTAHHELGHIYYYISYSTPKVPYLLRAGANRAFHEGIGDLIGLAAGQRPYLKQVGLLTPEAEKARCGHVPARHRARRLVGRLPALVGRRDDALRARLLRRQDLGRRAQRRLVGTCRPVSRGSRPPASAPRLSATRRRRRISTTIPRSITTTRSAR